MSNFFSALHQIADQYPPGCIIYHKGSGDRGSVSGYTINADGSVRLLVDFAPEMNYAFCPISSVTTVKPSKDDPLEGDEWKTA